MREIKFKSISQGERKWIIGDLCTNYEGEPESIYIIDEDCTYHRVDPETVCQYTGLKDKNGKEVFEGDVLSSELYGDGVVTWDNNKSEFNVVQPNQISFVNGFGEVIGNIHDKKGASDE